MKIFVFQNHDDVDYNDEREVHNENVFSFSKSSHALVHLHQKIKRGG